MNLIGLKRIFVDRKCYEEDICNLQKNELHVTNIVITPTIGGNNITLELNDGSTVGPELIADGGSQTISFSNPDLTISGGNTIDISDVNYWDELAGDLTYVSGNVGIGTIPFVPGHNLHIQGNTRFEGNIYDSNDNYTVGFVLGATASGVEWVPPSVCGTCIENIVEDTTPQLGGDLDGQGNQITDIVIDSVDNYLNSNATSINVYNDTGSTLTKGTPVYISGYNVGQSLPEVAETDSDNSSKMPSIGLVASDILNASEGRVRVEGLIEGLDTTGTPYGEVWSFGEYLYINDVEGDLTNTKPTSSSEIQKIALVVRVDAVDGVLAVVGSGVTHDLQQLSEDFIWVGNSDKEAVEIATNTAFNKNFGTGAGEVAEGNHTHPGLMSWNEVTGTSITMSPYNGYIANNAGLVTLTLPATSVLGDEIRVVGKGIGGWRIAQAAGQVIHFGEEYTTVGVGGYVESDHFRDAISLVCVTNNSDWQVMSSIGRNITVV